MVHEIYNIVVYLTTQPKHRFLAMPSAIKDVPPSARTVKNGRHYLHPPKPSEPKLNNLGLG